MPWPEISDLFEPGFRRFSNGDGVFNAVILGDAAMGAWADARIVVTAPIKKIVPRLRSRPRVVRHFVGGEARGIAKLLGEEIEGLGLLCRQGTSGAPEACSAANGVPGSMVS